MRTIAAALLTLPLLSCAAAPAPAPSSPRVVYLGDDRDVAAHDQWHYAPVVRTGDLVVLSGIAAARGAPDEEKIQHMFERARALLAAAGASFDDVVEITTFHTATTHDDLERAFATFANIHATIFKPPYPAWTAIGNAILLNKDAIVEMRVVAVVRSGEGARVQRPTGASTTP